METEPVMYLKKLGLPEYEAHTYVCLLQAVSRPLRKSLTVSMSLQPRVYDALDELSQKGFVNVQPGGPKKFGPVELEAAFEHFCEFKQYQYGEEMFRMQHPGERLADAVDNETAPTDGSEICWVYSDRHRIFEKSSELTTATTTEIRMITTPFSFERIPNHYVEGLTRKTEAGTTIQAVVSRGQAIEPTI